MQAPAIRPEGHQCRAGRDHEGGKPNALGLFVILLCQIFFVSLRLTIRISKTGQRAGFAALHHLSVWTALTIDLHTAAAGPLGSRSALIAFAAAETG